MKLLISAFYLDYNYAIAHITLDLSTRYSHVHYRFENYLPFQCFWNKNHLKWLAVGNDFFFFFLSFFSFVKQLGLLWCSRSPSLPLPAVHRHSNKAGNTLTQLRCRSHSCKHLCSMTLHIIPQTPIFLVILSTLPLCIFIYIEMAQSGDAVLQACIIFNGMKCKKKRSCIGTLSVWSNSIF